MHSEERARSKKKHLGIFTTASGEFVDSFEELKVAESVVVMVTMVVDVESLKIVDPKLCAT